MTTTGEKQSGHENIDDEPLRHAPGALDVEFERFSLDDDGDSYELEKKGNDIHLEEWQADWKALTLTGTLTIINDLQHVFPPSEWESDPPAEVVLAVDCSYTHLREGHTVPVDSFQTGETDFELTLRSAEVYGTINVTPHLVRTDGTDASDDYRTFAGFELADGEPWQIHVDDIDDRSGPLLPPIFKSFEESDNDDRFPDDAVYVVDKQNLDDPKLFVNRDHEPIASALNTGPRGKLGRVMKVYTDSILLPALSELIVWTAKDLNEDGEAAHEWQEALLNQIVTEIYGVNSADEAARELYEDFDDETNVTQLLDQTSLALQDYLDLSDDMNKLVDKVRS